MNWFEAGVSISVVLLAALAYCYYLSMRGYAEGLAYEDTLSGEDREDYAPWFAREHYRKSRREFGACVRAGRAGEAHFPAMWD